MYTHSTFEIAPSSGVSQDPGVRALLAESLPGAVTFYPVDATIYAQGDETGPLYLVEFGTVRICQLTPDGRRQITSFCFAGDVFGLEPGAEHEFYAESVDGAGVRSLRAANATSFAQKLLSLALRRFARIQAHLVLLGRMSANERMASFLTDLLTRQDAGGLIHLPMQRNDIADYLGMTFETVSRVLRVFKDRGLIRVTSLDSIEVLDPKGLAALSE
jgi:CRP/FNR family nitrogen fixation transcriptional regulator